MKQIVFILLSILSFNFCYAQKQANIWYFGSYAGMDFNSGIPVALTNGAMSANEGCSSIADNSGNLLFYTDGISVWDASHTVMPNGTGLMGDFSSAQSAVIVPGPGSNNIYYIFTAGEYFGNGLSGYRYSTVDMTLNGGFGDVTATKNILLYAPACEKLGVVGNSSGNGYWIATHEFTTQNFVLYELTATGLSAPVVSSIGAVYSGFNPIGCLEFSSDGKHLATVLSGNNNVEVYDFDNATGLLSNPILLGPVGSGPPYVYDICFSPNGQLLYCSEENDNNLYQFDLSSGLAVSINATKISVGTSQTSALQTLQIGPDKKIYCTQNGSGYLGVVNDPDVPGLGCNFNNTGFFLAGKTCTYGLPGFVQSFFSNLSVLNTCFGDSTYFTIPNLNGLFAAQWNFGDTASGVNNLAYVYNPVHYFTSPGTYQVQVIEFNFSGINDTIYTSVTINANPQINLGNDTVLCIGNSILLNAGAGYTSYLWQDGSSGDTLTTGLSGNYFVTVNNNGCMTTDSILIQTITCAAPGINFASSDTNFCEKQCLDFFDLSTNNPTSWQWLFPGADSLSSTEQNPTGICYSAYGSFDVTLIACNGSGCDTLHVVNFINEFQPPPVPIITSNFDTLFSTLAYSYLWYNSSGIIPGEIFQYYIYPQQGSYYVVVKDSNGCATSSNVVYTSIEEAGAWSEEINLIPNPNNGNFEISYTGNVIKDLDIEITDVAGRVVYFSGFNAQNSKLCLGSVVNGIYFLHLSSNKKPIWKKFIVNKY